MNLVARLLCLTGHHRRSRGHARRVETGFTSRCRRCGVPMHKSAEGGVWKVDDAPVPSDVAAPTPPQPKSRRLWPFGKGRKSHSV